MTPVKKALISIAILAALVLAAASSFIAVIEIGARNGFREAQNELGRWYDKALWFHPLSKEDALYWYTKAATAGCPKAQFNLGLVMQEQGHYEQAAAWYARSAIQDFAQAQNNLAVLFEKGLGVTKNKRLANIWYEKAAQRGHEKAQFSLAIAYSEGSGVPLDHSKTAYWMQESANRGFAPAQNYLALLYAEGRGVPIDYELALAWARKAVANGYQLAEKTTALISEMKSGGKPNGRSATAGPGF